jgi:elongation factor Ts
MSISATMVKELREKTNAGMMDCKKALEEAKGDFEAAVEWLRKKGLASAAKKADRLASEGLVHSYIHGEGKVGVMLEVNSETDFVARNEQFKSFVNDIALHIAAMSPIAISTDEVPATLIAKEKEILRAKNIEQGKKPEMVDKIVEGQIKKWMSEVCLLEQSFVKNPDLKIADYLKETVARIGENLVIRRFIRYELGEGLEKRSNNFAEEVAAQTKGH